MSEYFIPNINPLIDNDLQLSLFTEEEDLYYHPMYYYVLNDVINEEQFNIFNNVMLTCKGVLSIEVPVKHTDNQSKLVLFSLNHHLSHP